MQIHDIEIGKLKAYEKNPRHNDEAVKPVANSIKEFGFKVPIVIDKDNVIVAGHTRVKAAKELGMRTVPCIVADDLTPEQIKAFRLADNKTGEFADWDVKLLEEELSSIDEYIDMEDFGFDSFSEDEFGDDFELPAGEKKQFQQISLTLHDEQAELLLSCIDYVYAHNEVNLTFGNTNHNGNGVYEVVRQWAEQKKLC